MSSLQDAIKYDVNQQIVLAAEAYEATISVIDAPSEAYINLACLYWRASDFGFYAHHRLGDDFFMQAVDRSFYTLQIASLRFPDMPEIAFWERYIRWALWGEDFSDEECLTIAKMPQSSLVPYFRLYLPLEKKYLREAQMLLKDCQGLKTTKNLYIISILKSKLEVAD